VESSTIRGKTHYVFEDEEEYRKFFNGEVEEVKYWKDGEEGDWVKADDGGIVQLVKVSDNISHPGDSKNYKVSKGWCRTVVGTFLKNKNAYMDTDFKQHPNRYTFSKKIKDTGKRVRERKNVTKNEKLFSVNVASGMGVVNSYMEAYSEIDSEKAKKKALILLKQDRVMKEIDRNVNEVAKSLGVDHEYVLSKLKHLADYSDDSNIVLQSTKELGKIIGTASNAVKHSQLGVIGMFEGFTKDQLKIADRNESEVKETED
tara:strand:+ start:89 stop:865 length:777 start_codon:yes stop_codon:yes gene_type:complete